MIAVPTPSLGPRTRQYVTLLRILAGVYAGLAVLFFFLPSQFLYLVNIGPKVFGLGQAAELPPDRYWVVMAVAAVAMESVLSLMASREPKATGYTMIQLLSKAISFTGFVYCFIVDAPLFTYLSAALFDGAVGVLLLWTFARSRGEVKA